ncbi:hypothetical protein [Acetobacter senegalensis]|uniref:hypothetical protein n=1 Tax=Acetobacter senegalensis TaxID=446692 RepID=UPI002653404E|nr:hypothetical protein [Acetobacter senegalensis]MDN7350407.1 hypothetical protein [Acetobacter senegalensis]
MLHYVGNNSSPVTAENSTGLVGTWSGNGHTIPVKLDLQSGASSIDLSRYFPACSHHHGNGGRSERHTSPYWTCAHHPTRDANTDLSGSHWVGVDAASDTDAFLVVGILVDRTSCLDV